MSMKTFSVFIISTLLHSYCCLLPVFLSFWGSSMLMSHLLNAQPFFWVVQGVILGISLFRYYRSGAERGKSSRIRMLLTWVLLLYSVIILVVPHTDLFKSDEQKIMERQISTILNKYR